MVCAPAMLGHMDEPPATPAFSTANRSIVDRKAEMVCHAANGTFFPAIFINNPTVMSLMIRLDFAFFSP